LGVEERLARSDSATLQLLNNINEGVAQQERISCQFLDCAL